MQPQLTTFFCIDGHTCGNPVRLVAGGAPDLSGRNMSEKRQDFLDHHDWIRTALMFEPRGHDMMSGAFLYPPMSADANLSILFIETSGCLPMCGHGTIGALTLGIQHGLIELPPENTLLIDTPAGLVTARVDHDGQRVSAVRLDNVASYLAEQDIVIDCPGLGELVLDIAYGGNFYAIIDPQKNFAGLQQMSAAEVLHYSPLVRRQLEQSVCPVHPLDDSIRGVSHVMWTGATLDQSNQARNAVFYGDKAIDRSPCGTGTSARMAQWHARGRLGAGEAFRHESIIGSVFHARIEATTTLASHDAILPSFSGWARMTGLNTLFVDQQDPYWNGFQVT